MELLLLSCFSLQELLCAFQQPAINLLLPFHPSKMTGALHPQWQKILIADKSCPSDSLCVTTVPRTKLFFPCLPRSGLAVPIMRALVTTSCRGFCPKSCPCCPGREGQHIHIVLHEWDEMNYAFSRFCCLKKLTLLSLQASFYSEFYNHRL